MIYARIVLASLVALGIGGAVTFIPTKFSANSGVEFPNDVNLSNDFRGFGGGLLGAGIFFAIGLFNISYLKSK